MGAGLFIIPLIFAGMIIGGAIYLFKQINSGSTFTSKSGIKYTSDKRPPVYNCWGFYVLLFGVIGLVGFAILNK